MTLHNGVHQLDNKASDIIDAWYNYEDNDN